MNKDLILMTTKVCKNGLRFETLGKSLFFSNAWDFSIYVEETYGIELSKDDFKGLGVGCLNLGDLF